MPVFTATARSVSGSLQHEVDVNGRHTIITDEPIGLGGSDAGPAPHELLPAMVASCISTMLVLYAQRRGWSLEPIQVDVTYDSETTPRHTAIVLHLPSGLSEDQIHRLQRVADTCPVKRALEAGFAFERRVMIADVSAFA